MILSIDNRACMWIYFLGKQGAGNVLYKYLKKQYRVFKQEEFISCKEYLHQNMSCHFSRKTR